MPQFVKDINEIRQRAIRNIEEGAVTNAYQLDKEHTVAILNEALATEIVCVLRYLHHYFMATGVHGKSVANEFKEHADAEREHADEIAERIQQLGGKPDFNPASLVNRSVSHYIEGETLGDMIREDLIAERVVIEVYSNMIRYFGDKDPTTRILLEHILAEEEEHASDLVDLLYIVEPSTGKDLGIDPGTHPLDARGGEGGGEAQRQGGRSQGRVSERGGEIPAGRRQESLQGNTGNIEPFSGRGTALPDLGKRGASEAQGEARPARATGRERPAANTAPPEHQPGTTGRPIRQRPQQTADADVDEEPEDNAQMGTSRAVRISRPNRKKRIA
jgi:bacterioferritin